MQLARKLSALYHNCDHRAQEIHMRMQIMHAAKSSYERRRRKYVNRPNNCFASAFTVAYKTKYNTHTHTRAHTEIAIDMKYHNHHLSLKYLWLVAPMWVYVPISHQMVAQRPVQNHSYIVAIQTMWWNNICTCRNGIVNGLHQDTDALMHLSPIFACPVHAAMNATCRRRRKRKRKCKMHWYRLCVTFQPFMYVCVCVYDIDQNGRHQKKP